MKNLRVVGETGPAWPPASARCYRPCGRPHTVAPTGGWISPTSS